MNTLARTATSESFIFVALPATQLNSNVLYMGDLEPWMDHEYASQVVHIMGWDCIFNINGLQNGAVTIKIPPHHQMQSCS